MVLGAAMQVRYCVVASIEQHISTDISNLRPDSQGNFSLTVSDTMFMRVWSRTILGFSVSTMRSKSVLKDRRTHLASVSAGER